MATDIRELWNRVLRGDHRAWQELVGRYATLVYTVACRAGLSRLDAEDCAQHTWLALYRRRRAIKDPAAIPAWLIKTTHREAIRTYRSLSRSSGLDYGSDSSASVSRPDEAADSLEFQLALGKAMDRLDPRCRRLITEMYFSNPEKKYRDVASLLGVKPNSLGPLRKRCLIKLKEILTKMGYSMD